MKHYVYVLAASAAALLASCSDHQDAPSAPSANDGQIRFSASTQTPTRAYQYGTDVTTNNLDEFNVFAYLTAPSSTAVNVPYMNNVKVTKGTDNVWTYSPVQYWPSSPLNFYALAPMDGWNPSGAELNVLGPLHYSNATGGYDLVYATAMNRTQPTTPAADAQVRFNFRHALSKIQVNMKATPSSMSVLVGLVTVNNICSEGDFQMPTVTTTANPGAATSSGSWSNLEDPVAYPVNFPQMQSERVLLTTDYTQLNPPLAEYGGMQMLGAYMLPQSVAWNKEAPLTGPCLRIHLSIYDNATHTIVWPNANTPGEMLEDPDHPLNNQDGIVTFPLSTTAQNNGDVEVRSWQGGDLYIYNITIDPSQLLGQIEFGQPTVDGFVTVESAY